MALTPSWPGPTGLASTTDARKNLAGLVETDSSGNVRSGVFPSHVNGLVTARTDMNVDIGIFQAVAVQFGGPVLIANDGVAQLPSPLVSPGAGTNFYVVYAKQNESTSPGTDANNNRVFGASLSTSTFAAARALLPTGAVELATVQMPSGKTATNQSGVVITPTFQYTAAEGGTVWLRNSTEQSAWTPADGALAWRMDTSQVMVYMANATTPGWFPFGGKPDVGAYTGAGTTPAYSAGAYAPRASRIAGRVYLEGQVVSTAASFAAFTTYTVGSIPSTFAPPALIGFPIEANGAAAGEGAVDTSGNITMRLFSLMPSSGTAALSLWLNASWRDKNI